MLETILNAPSTPEFIKVLPRDHRGYPIPWFVYRDRSGTPDFRVASTHKIFEAVSDNRCWICGCVLLKHKAFVVGPVGTINRISPEPPSHRGCAMFAASVCPFLMAHPQSGRNPKDLPFDREPAPNARAKRHPGVVAVWIARDYRLLQGDTNVLFLMGEPIEPIHWYREAKLATHSQVLEAMTKSLAPYLDEARDEGDEALAHLLAQIHRASAYLPDKAQDAA